MVLYDMDGWYLVLCTCGEEYYAHKELNSEEKYGDLYAVCPTCLKREGIALEKVVSC